MEVGSAASDTPLAQNGESNSTGNCYNDHTWNRLELTIISSSFFSSRILIVSAGWQGALGETLSMLPTEHHFTRRGQDVCRDESLNPFSSAGPAGTFSTTGSTFRASLQHWIARMCKDPRLLSYCQALSQVGRRS